MRKDFLGAELNDGDTVAVVVFQTPTIGQMSYGHDSFTYVDFPGLCTWFRADKSTGRFHQIVKINPFTIIPGSGHRDCLDRSLALGDTVVVRKGAKYVEYGVITGFTDTFCLVNGRRRSGKYLVKV